MSIKTGAFAALMLASNKDQKGKTQMIQPHSHSHLWPGVPLALGSAALFGAVSPLSKLLLDVVSPLMLATTSSNGDESRHKQDRCDGLLYLGAGLGLALFWFYRNSIGEGANEASLQRADLPWLAAVVAGVP